MGKILHIYLPEWFSIAGHFGAVRDARSRSEQRIHQPHKKADDHRMGRALPRPRVGSFVPGWQPPRRNVYGAKKKDTFPCPFPGLSPGRKQEDQTECMLNTTPDDLAFRKATNANPSRPVPRSRRLLGSGVAAAAAFPSQCTVWTPLV